MICAFLLVSLITVSCKKTVTESLKPSNQGTSESVDADWTKKIYCISLPTKATNPESLKTNEVLVGYKRFYWPGTKPLPCDEWSTCVYRGAFRFDLSKYMGKGVVSAILHIGLGQAQYSSGSVASNEGAWIKSICVSTSEWWNKPNPYYGGSKNYLFPCSKIPGMPDLPHGLNPTAQKDFPVKFNGVNSYQIDVTSTVRDWASGKAPNLGFILVGTNESSVARSRDRAVSPVDSVSLDITYAK